MFNAIFSENVLNLMVKWIVAQGRCETNVPSLCTMPLINFPLCVLSKTVAAVSDCINL